MSLIRIPIQVGSLSSPIYSTMTKLLVTQTVLVFCWGTLQMLLGRCLFWNRCWPGLDLFISQVWRCWRRKWHDRFWGPKQVESPANSPLLIQQIVPESFWTPIDVCINVIKTLLKTKTTVTVCPWKKGHPKGIFIFQPLKISAGRKSGTHSETKN